MAEWKIRMKCKENLKYIVKFAIEALRIRHQCQTTTNKSIPILKLYYKLDDSLCFHKINRFCLIFKTNNEALEGSFLEVIFVDFFPNDENRLTVDRRAGDTSLRHKTKERKKNKECLSRKKEVNS